MLFRSPIRVQQGDFRELDLGRRFALVTGSPPYFPTSAGVLPQDPQRLACRFELRGGVEAYCQTAARHLRDDGRFFLVHQTVCEERVQAAARAAGLHVHTVLDAHMRTDREAPFLSVYELAHAAPDGSIVRVGLSIRGDDGEFTEGYQRARRELGVEPPKGPVKPVVDPNAKKAEDEPKAAGGIEGGVIYAIASFLRDEIEATGRGTLRLDLAPDRELPRLIKDLSQPRGKKTMATHLQRRAHIDGVKAGLLREIVSKEDFTDPTRLATAIKSLQLTVKAPRPLTEAISTAGGVEFQSLDKRLRQGAQARTDLHHPVAGARGDGPHDLVDHHRRQVLPELARARGQLEQAQARRDELDNGPLATTIASFYAESDPREADLRTTIGAVLCLGPSPGAGVEFLDRADIPQPVVRRSADGGRLGQRPGPYWPGGG